MSLPRRLPQPADVTRHESVDSDTVGWKSGCHLSGAGPGHDPDGEREVTTLLASWIRDQILDDASLRSCHSSTKATLLRAGCAETYRPWLEAMPTTLYGTLFSAVSTNANARRAPGRTAKRR